MKFLLLFIPMIAFAVMLDANAPPEIIPNTYKGFPYPINGMEHVIVMLGVGLLASRYQGRRRWVLPAAFILMMSVGLATGILVSSDYLQATEIVVMGSLLISSLLVMSGRSPRLSIVVPGFSILAFAHGYAHGILTPPDLNSVAYSREIIAATTIFIFLGMGLGILIRLLVRNWHLHEVENGAV